MSYNIPEAPQAQEQQNFKAQQKAKAQQKEKKLSLCDKKPNKKKEKDVRLKEAMEDARAEGLTSYMEITFAFWDAGMRLDEVSENPEAYSKCIRKCINQALKAFPNTPIVPGSQIAKCKSWGRTLPAGCLKGCILRIEHSALKRLAFTVLHGKSHLLSSWGTPF